MCSMNEERNLQMASFHKISLLNFNRISSILKIILIISELKH